ncbi:MAG: YtcA family lipoprotein [Terracidiphilus sp.]
MLVVFIMGLTGCGRAPSFNIAGSFFPFWIFCVVAGTMLAVLARALFVRLEIEKEIKPAVLVYPCIAASSAITLWLLFLG